MNERARTLFTLVLIVFSTVLSMSMVFVAASGLAALIIYVSTDDVVAGLAISRRTGDDVRSRLARARPPCGGSR